MKKILTLMFSIGLLSNAYAGPKRVDVPAKLNCIFVNNGNSIQKTFRTEKVTYPYQENIWWTAISDSEPFWVGKVQVTDLFIRAYDYKSDGGGSSIQISVKLNKDTQTNLMSNKDPLNTPEVSIYSKDGAFQLKINCHLSQ